MLINPIPKINLQVLLSVRKEQDDDNNDKDKIHTQVDYGASGGPVMNSCDEIVGVTVAMAGQYGGDGCLAISVERIHEFLEDAEKEYEQAQKFGKHGIKFGIPEIEVDGKAPKYFKIEDYSDRIDALRTKFANEDVRRKVFQIRIDPPIKEGEAFTPSSPGVNLLLDQINRGLGEFTVCTTKFYYR